MSNRRKYTDEQFIDAVKNSKSIRQSLYKLGLVPAGGNYEFFRKNIKRLNLTTSHFTGKGHLKDKTHNYNTKSLDDYFSGKYPIQSHKLKIRLLKEGLLKHKCYKCNLTEWNNQPIPIELEHIDGNHLNNNLSNLTILCPNCHAQTPTYRGKNKKKS